MRNWCPHLRAPALRRSAPPDCSRRTAFQRSRRAEPPPARGSGGAAAPLLSPPVRADLNDASFHHDAPGMSVRRRRRRRSAPAPAAVHGSQPAPKRRPKRERPLAGERKPAPSGPPTHLLPFLGETRVFACDLRFLRRARVFRALDEHGNRNSYENPGSRPVRLLSCPSALIANSLGLHM
jgi:hypothetical protein